MTGGTRGIGLAIAERLGEAEATVLVTGRRPTAEGLDGFEYRGVDFADGPALEAFAEEARAWAPDVLVNNAGINTLAPFAEIVPEDFDRIQAVNVRAPMLLCRGVVQGMRERGWGRIVNMASVAGTLGGFGQASYSTTKAGILGLTKTLAMEGGRHGITCNAIVPGIIGTEAFHMANAATNERIAQRTVFKRPGEPQDIANAIAFLCSNLAGYITGIELNVSGGVELFVF